MSEVLNLALLFLPSVQLWLWTLFTCRPALSGNNQTLTTCFQGLNSVNSFMEDQIWTSKNFFFPALTVLNWMRTKVFQTPQPCHACTVTVPIICFWIPDWCFAFSALQTWTWMENKTCRQVVQLKCDCVWSTLLSVYYVPRNASVQRVIFNWLSSPVLGRLRTDVAAVDVSLFTARLPKLAALWLKLKRKNLDEIVWKLV